MRRPCSHHSTRRLNRGFPVPLYFAYGANMDVAAMAARCPRSRSRGLARLNNHRFFIMAEGYASVRREPGASVHGMVWDLALADVAALDRFEDVAHGLYAKRDYSVTCTGGAHRALVYVGRNLVRGLAQPGYMGDVLAAAVAAGLPEPYLRELRSWVPQLRRVPHSAPAIERRVIGWPITS